MNNKHFSWSTLLLLLWGRQYDSTVRLYIHLCCYSTCQLKRKTTVNLRWHATHFPLFPHCLSHSFGIQKNRWNQKCTTVATLFPSAIQYLHLGAYVYMCMCIGMKTFMHKFLSNQIDVSSHFYFHQSL